MEIEQRKYYHFGQEYQDMSKTNELKSVKNLALSGMRSNFFYYHVKEQVINNAISKKTGPRGGKLYDCAICSAKEDKAFKRDDIEVDHIEPVVPLDRAMEECSIQELYDRLYCEADNLRTLCKPCHHKVSAEQNAIRAKNKKEKAKTKNK